MPSTISVTRAAPATTITLRRPEVHNALNPAMIAELADAFREEGARPESRLIVLAAEGKSFCAGADLNWMRDSASYSQEANLADALNLARMLQAVYACPKPVIARVQGSAYGGGVGLIAACDLAVAVESAALCLTEAKIGLVPAVIAPFLLQKVSPATARRCMLTAAPMRAAEARSVGLVNMVVDSLDAADAVIDDWATAIAANGPVALAACKCLLGVVAAPQMDELLRQCAGILADVRAGEESREGIKAFLEKRPPRWRAGGGGVL
jgi:methylglutaconyl-CoA hydratase